MKKLLLTSLVLILGGICYNASAQEDLYWKMQHYDKSIAEDEIKNETSQFMAYQVIQKNPESNQQKDPARQTSQNDEQKGIEAGDEKVNAEGSLFYPEQLQLPDVKKETPVIKEEPEKETKAEAKEDDSVLEFNFLYFIIHKFKLSDILE